MPSPIAHLSAGCLIGRKAKLGLWEMFAVLALSQLPDLDSIPGILFGDFGKYHNNLTHSIFFCVAASAVVGMAVSMFWKGKGKRWFLLSLIASSLHLLMDLFTTGRGQMLFWPITSARFKPPFQFFYGLQWSKGLFSISHLWTTLNEVAVILVVVLVYVLLKRRGSIKNPEGVEQ